MATVQALRPRTSAQPQIQQTATATNTTIDTKQSTEVVQTLIHGSISCLAYLRGLFADSCFDEQFYETNDSHWSYVDYAAGENQPRERRHAGTRMRVLRRGRSNAVDRLLDWLENGAFDALERKVLRALQLNIFEDPTAPSNVMEVYTFSFHYTEAPTSRGEVSGVEMAGPHGERVSIRNAKHGMQMFIRRIIALCGTLPDLPRRRFLNMHLFYSDDCDPDYQPPGFSATADTSIHFPNGQWRKVSTSCGGMSTGFHTVALQVSHLHLAEAAENMDAQPTTDQAVPDNLSYTETAAREDDIKMVPEANEDSPWLQDSAEPDPGTRSLVSVSLDDASHDMVQGTEDAATTVDGASPASNSQGPDVSASGLAREMCGELVSTPQTYNQLTNVSPAQEAETTRGSGGTVSTGNKATEAGKDGTTPAASDDVRMKLRLQQMLEPSADVSGQGDTQLQSQTLAGPEKHLGQGLKMNVLQLSQRTIRQLEFKRSNLLPPRKSTANVRGRTEDLGTRHENDIVECQCGWDEEEDDMINCNFCDTWQHLHCYGFRGSDDPRIPLVHACYRCLLQEKEIDLLRELRDLALLRRGVHILEENGFSNDKDFSAKLRCDLQTASRLVKHLRKEGYLVQAGGSRKKDYGSKGRVRFSISKADAVVTRMMKQYFDPTAKIAHHFELPHQPHDTRGPMPTSRPSANDREKTGGRVTPGAGAEAGGTQSSRYPLRHRQLDVASTAVRRSPRRAAKRGRVEEESVGLSTPNPKRRMKSSVTTGMINIEETPTPSPMSKPSRF